MGLVTQPLHQVERRGGRRQQDRLVAIGQEDFLALLGQADHRQIAVAQLPEHLHRGRKLPLPAVDHDKIWHLPAQLLFVALLAAPRTLETAPQHFLVAGEVVGSLHFLDPEAAVFAGPGPPFLEDDHASDRLRTPEVADVVALDSRGQAG